MGLQQRAHDPWLVQARARPAAPGLLNKVGQVGLLFTESEKVTLEAPGNRQLSHGQSTGRSPERERT